MSNEAIFIFTSKEVEQLLDEGGSCSWRLDPNHARRCPFAVITRNAYDWTKGKEAHGAAFLVARVKDVVPSSEMPARWLIEFSEFARMCIPNAWKGGRNPVRYGGLEDVGIDPSKLNWEPMPPRTEEVTPSSVTARALTMAEAKAGLALAFGVSPEAIEITIRG